MLHKTLVLVCVATSTVIAQKPLKGPITPGSSPVPGIVEVQPPTPAGFFDLLEAVACLKELIPKLQSIPQPAWAEASHWKELVDRLARTCALFRADDHYMATFRGDKAKGIAYTPPDSVDTQGNGEYKPDPGNPVFYNRSEWDRNDPTFGPGGFNPKTAPLHPPSDDLSRKWQLTGLVAHELERVGQGPPAQVAPGNPPPTDLEKLWGTVVTEVNLNVADAYLARFISELPASQGGWPPGMLPADVQAWATDFLRIAVRNRGTAVDNRVPGCPGLENNPFANW